MEFPDLALLWVPEAYSLEEKGIMGRQSAGAGFIRAIAAAAPPRLYCYANTRAEAEAFRRTIETYGGVNTEINWVPLERPTGLRHPGLLYRPDANIASDAWRRAAHGLDRAYSICGVTHTTATHVIMESLAALLTAPLHSWDALVCTSQAVRDSVRSILEAAAEHLKSHLGATRLPTPQVPLIPLGVDCNAYNFNDNARTAARKALGIEPDEILVVFVGRLSFHSKAHHVPMYLALEQAAAGQRVVLLQAGWFGSDAVEAAFRDEARQFCPSVRCLFADGRDSKVREQVWAAADVFTSLVDNFQETFGLTPIEAMAAGLPSVVSDWNGYRDTVRDGIDGFRVPTLTMPPGSGGDLADRYDWGIDSYEFYIFHGSQLVAVDVDVAADAYRRLITNPALRAGMGSAARSRARAEFDWSAVRSKYVALWHDLAERRRADPAFYLPQTPRRRPDRADPFTMFATYPTHVIGSNLRFQRSGTLAQATERRNLNSTGKAAAVLPTPELVSQLLELIPANDWIGVDELVRACPAYSDVIIGRALAWLSKFGVLRSRA
jgi:glycosyltransferase involved in cell wall biosynthesis